MIDDYFQELLALISASPVIRASEMTFDKRSAYIGYVRGDIYFLDDSRLHVREFVNTQSDTERFTYVYHYQQSDGTLIFRYDNTPHFPELPDFLHHKHVATEKQVSTTAPPDLSSVLNEIENLI